MKFQLTKTSEFTSSFIELARLIESCSALDATEAISVAKHVMYSGQRSHDLFVNFRADTNVEELENRFAEHGVRLKKI